MRTHRLVGVVLIVSLVLGGVLAQVPGAAGAAQGEACFAETGHCIRGRFLDYWRANGGLARNGFPLSEERRETLEDGNEYVVQYFERVRLEYHSLNPAPYDVLLGQFGRRVLRERFRDDVSRYQRTIAPVDPATGQAYFRETGHNLGGRFLTYWEANGGLTQFGYPLTEEFGEALDDGRFYEVQYFERGRLEYHPENAGTPFEVLLGQFGRGILAQADLLAGAPSFNRLYITDQDVRERLGRPLASAVETLVLQRDFGAATGFLRRTLLTDSCQIWCQH